MDWKPYPNGRKMKDYGDYVVVVPQNLEKKSMPLFCEVCDVVYRSKEDKKTFEKFGCCSACADVWAYSNSEAWLRGWRPSKEQVELNVQKRLFKDVNITFE